MNKKEAKSVNRKNLWIIGAVVLLAAVLGIAAVGRKDAAKRDDSGPSAVESAAVDRYALAKQGGKWNAEYLNEVKSGDMPAPPEGVYMTLNRVTEDGVIATMHNETAESWEYGYGYTLQVKLDDVWYIAPEVPGKERNYVLIGFSLNPGDSVEDTYGLGWWGDLPTGTYRLVKDIHQGTVPENTFVQKCLTVEFEIG